MTYQVIPSDEIDSRAEFSLLCNWRRLYKAVEIGTDRGEFAAQFLSGWLGHTMFCVDPFLPYIEKPWERESDYRICLSMLAPHASKVRLVRQAGDEFAESLRSGKGPEYPWQFGFVYIDADHSYDSTKRDIETWWPFIEEGGILAGHDFTDDHPGVIKAVTEHASRHSAIVRTTREPTCQSWYVYKNEPSKKHWKRIPW